MSRTFERGYLEDKVELQLLLDAVTTTTTSAALAVAGASKITLLFTRANHATGSSTFTVNGLVDGATSVALNILIDNLTNTNAQQVTRIASSALSSNTSKVYALDLEYFGFDTITITATVATDGNATCYALVEYD